MTGEELREKIAEKVRDIRLDAKGTHGALGVTSSDERWADRILALLPTEGEPPTDEQWEAVRQHVLGFAAYVLARGGLDVEGHKGDRAAYDATVTGACLRFSVSDEAPADTLKELKEKLYATPQESTDHVYDSDGDCERCGMHRVRCEPVEARTVRRNTETDR